MSWQWNCCCALKMYEWLNDNNMRFIVVVGISFIFFFLQYKNQRNMHNILLDRRTGTRQMLLKTLFGIKNYGKNNDDININIMYHTHVSFVFVHCLLLSLFAVVVVCNPHIQKICCFVHFLFIFFFLIQTQKSCIPSLIYHF